MGSLLLLAAVALVTYSWVRIGRKNRQLWLGRLALPGSWQWEQGDGVLELTGQLDSGRYSIREAGAVETGEWRLNGHTLLLLPAAGTVELAYDVRYFDAGKIGLHGPGRERRIYVKRLGNVVPLRRSGN